MTTEEHDLASSWLLYWFLPGFLVLLPLLGIMWIAFGLPRIFVLAFIAGVLAGIAGSMHAMSRLCRR
jgi:hypothetical protein